MSNTNMEIYYRSVLLNLEQAAKTNRFASKEEFNKYLEGIKKNGMPEGILTDEKKKELLDLYDEYHKTEVAGLDIQNYKGTNLNEQNYISSTKNDTVLKTNGSNSEMVEEFKKTQNELTSADKADSLANADTIYKHLQNNVKEEVPLVSLSEVISRNDISQELLNKIRFFVTNKYINPYSYKISPDSGIFYNTETDELLEVIKNTETGKYEIKKGGEVVYKEDSPIQEMTGDTQPENYQELDKDTNEEEMLHERDQHKVRRLLPPKDIHGQAAFAKTSFLIITSIFIALALSSLILLIK